MKELPQRILIAVDDSAYVMKAVKPGFSLAHGTHAVVGLGDAINQAKETVNADPGITPAQSSTILLKEAERTIEQYLKLYDGVEEVLRFTPTGIPEEVIANIAKEWQADMTVKESYGRILSGSTAEYVIRHATVPVLITPPRME